MCCLKRPTGIVCSPKQCEHSPTVAGGCRRLQWLPALQCLVHTARAYRPSTPPASAHNGLLTVWRLALCKSPQKPQYIRVNILIEKLWLVE